jgi:hypothetical protein
VPLFGKSNRASRDQASSSPPPAEVSSHEFALKLSYSAKSSEGIRLKTGPGLTERLHSMLAGYVQGETELVEPLPVELGQASPFIAQLPGSAQWLQYNHKRSPITRHALVVLGSVDAIDPVFETLVCGLLSGETDTTGYPEYNAIVGAWLASTAASVPAWSGPSTARNAACGCCAPSGVLEPDAVLRLRLRQLRPRGRGHALGPRRGTVDLPQVRWPVEEDIRRARRSLQRHGLGPQGEGDFLEVEST